MLPSVNSLGSQGPHCHTCPIPPEESGPAVDGIQETPASYAAPSFPGRCSRVLQAPFSLHKPKQRSHSLQSCSRPGHKGTGTPVGVSWWRGWGSRQRFCKGKRSQGKKQRSKKAGGVGYCSSGQELPGHLKGEPAVVSPLWGIRGPGTAWTGTRTETHGHAGRRLGAQPLHCWGSRGRGKGSLQEREPPLIRPAPLGRPALTGGCGGRGAWPGHRGQVDNADSRRGSGAPVSVLCC